MNLESIHAPLRPHLLDACARVIDSQRFIGGDEVARLESMMCELTGARHAIGVSSGTDALLAALMALEIGPGDEVITTPFTFFATAGCIARVGAKPVFVDIDERTFNLDPERVEDAITPRTRAIIPVHLFGQLAPMAPLGELARRYGLAIIEDAAQAIGAGEDADAAEMNTRGRAGSLGDVGCFSFFPTKNLGGFGDGGMITCQDDDLADRIRVYCRHGAQPKYHHAVVGGNFRLDALQAALLAVKAEHLAHWTRQRQASAALYDHLLASREDVATPAFSKREAHVYNQYCVLIDDRDAVREQLTREGIGTMVYYPKPLHLQDCFVALGYESGSLPVTERTCERILALPIWPGLQEAQVEHVASALRAALEARAAH